MSRKQTLESEWTTLKGKNLIFYTYVVIFYVKFIFSVLVDWILTILIDEMRTVIYFFKLRNWALVENRRIIIFICQSPLIFQKYYISCSFAILLCVGSKLLGQTIQYRMTVPQINCQNILKETIISNTNIVLFFPLWFKLLLFWT